MHLLVSELYKFVVFVFPRGSPYALSIHMHAMCATSKDIVELITLLFSERSCEYIKVVHPILFQILR